MLTERFREVVARVEQLPQQEQDALAETIEAELNASAAAAPAPSETADRGSGTATDDTGGAVEAPTPELLAEAQRMGLDPANMSALGWRLLELRQQVVASGIPLLSSWEELDREMAEIRGEHYPDEDE